MVNEDATFQWERKGADRYQVISHDQFEEGVSKHKRALYSSLLQVPHLERLELRIEKAFEGPLEARDFSPILYQLHKIRPNIRVTVSISFDALLSHAWCNESWSSNDEDPFVPAGSSDCTVLFDAPSDEDRAYVAEFLVDEDMPRGREAVRGLLDESLGGRKLLQAYYAVHEPSLFKVDMEIHWGIYCTYQRVRGMRENEIK